jgi:menaquinone-dependent protoporphyrinogen oxidase
MSHILIAYASHYGQTEKIATRIADDLREKGHEVALVDARAGAVPEPASFDLVVLGSRIETGHHATEIYAYIRAHLDALEVMPTAFFSVSSSAARPDPGPDPNGYLATMFADLAWTPTRSIAFGGGLPYLKYGWFMRFIMKRISRAGGHTTDTTRNHEMTDWGAVHHFADELSSLIRPELAVSRL